MKEGLRAVFVPPHPPDCARMAVANRVKKYFEEKKMADEQKENTTSLPPDANIAQQMGIVGVRINAKREHYQRLVDGELRCVGKCGVEGTLDFTFEDGSMLPVKLTSEDLQLFMAIASQQPAVRRSR